MDRRQILALAAGSSSFAAALAGRLTSGGRLIPGAGLVRKGYLDTDIGQIFYWTAGHGPNVTFVHQSGNSSKEYESLVPLLKDDFRLIALDLPGHGRSDDPRSEPDVDDYTIAIERVLEHLGVSSTHIVGHHGGALAAMNFAARNPRITKRSVLSGLGGLKTPAESQKFIDSILSTDTTLRADSEFITATWERYVSMMSDGAEVAGMVRPFLAFLDARLRPFSGLLVNLRWDRREALSKLRGPVLLVQGERDQFVSKQASLLKVIPRSSRIELPGCGTFMFYDQAEVCANVLKNFLKA